MEYFFKFLLSLICLQLCFGSIFADESLVCKGVSCGEGKCVASNSSIFGHDCVCNQGWKKFQIGPLPPSCLIPNCSFDFGCGQGTPQSLGSIPLFNFTNPCNLVWCNYGECLVNGSKHICQCQDGNENLFDNPEFACFPQCAFGADCKNVGLGPQSPPPPVKSNTGEKNHSTPSDSGTYDTGSKSGANNLKKIQASAVIILSAILHAWI